MAHDVLSTASLSFFITPFDPDVVINAESGMLSTHLITDQVIGEWF